MYQVSLTAGRERAMKLVIQLMAVIVIILSAFHATAGTHGNEIEIISGDHYSDIGGILAASAYAASKSDTGHEGETSADSSGHEGDGQGHENLGESLPLWSCIPFAGMLLSIALFPLLAPDFWHHHFGKVSAFWAATLGIPFLIAFRGLAVYEILHIILADYVPFIILLWSLYTVSGGILLRGTLRGTPMLNTIILIIGALLASWMGTTGAAMLLTT